MQGCCLRAKGSSLHLPERAACAHAHTHTQPYHLIRMALMPRAHANTRAHMYSNTCAHTHTHTHARTQLCSRRAPLWHRCTFPGGLWDSDRRGALCRMDSAACRGRHTMLCCRGRHSAVCRMDGKQIVHGPGCYYMLLWAMHTVVKASICPTDSTAWQRAVQAARTLTQRRYPPAQLLHARAHTQSGHRQH